MWWHMTNLKDVINVIVFMYLLSLGIKDPVPYPAPLPPFSMTVKEVIQSELIHKTLNWNQLLLESAFFYLALLPSSEGPARISYNNIGRTLFEKYPAISSKGAAPWVCYISAYY